MGKGHLVIGGGAINASEDLIFSAFLKYAGGAEGAKISVIVSASGCPVESYQSVAKTLQRLGLSAGSLRCVPLTFVPELLRQGWNNTGDSSLLPYFDGTTGVWLTGGDQVKLAASLLQSNGEDTPVLAAIRALLASGGVVGGTSAGAAVMGIHMIGCGSDEGALRFPVCTDVQSYTAQDEAEERLLLAKGLGFFTEGIVDQHFNARPRLQRMMRAMSFLGENFGYGISEDTALCVSLNNQSKSILGSGSVMQVVRGESDSFTTSHLISDK